jgi:hypothetical protein
MDDALALFLSLPIVAQTNIRTLANQSDPLNLRTKLTRALCPYVQTLAEAQNIADLFAAESDLAIENRELMGRKRHDPAA